VRKTDNKKLTDNLRYYLASVFFVPLQFLHLFTFLAPRSKRIWIFGSWDGKVFLDNSKYFYLYVSRNQPDILAIWISQNRTLVKQLQKSGYNACYAWSLRGIYYCLRAKFYFIDYNPGGIGNFFAPINLWLSGNAKIIQLWHGLPLKEIGSHDSIGNAITSASAKLWKKLRVLYWFSAEPLNYNVNKFVVVPRFFEEIFKSAFRLRKDRVVVAGYPRNDVLLGLFNYLPKSPVRCKLDELKTHGKTLLFYFPTFRDTGTTTLNSVDFDKFEAFLEARNCVLVAKLHDRDLNLRSILQNRKNVLLLPRFSDLYEILTLGDLLITDYSSVFFDFLLVDKPIVFFAYDFQKYQTADRALYFDYKNFVPGPIAATFEELLGFVQIFLDKDTDEFRERRQQLKIAVFGKAYSQSSSKVIADWIMTHLADS
jgi:CDP-glycerol glycerophosphotransferase (TagB/SpsB family)